MSYWRMLVSPAGVLGMLVALWLPWAHVSCSQMQASPTYWQLSDYDHRLYAMAAFVVVIAGFVVWYIFQRKRAAAMGTVCAAAAAALSWGYLWIKRNDLASYQAQAALQGGDLGRLMQDMNVATGAGFHLYLQGALLALLGAVLWLLEKRTNGSSP